MINNPPSNLLRPYECDCNRVNLCQTYKCCPSYRTNCNGKFQIRKCLKKRNNDNANIFYIFCESLKCNTDGATVDLTKFSCGNYTKEFTNRPNYEDRNFRNCRNSNTYPSQILNKDNNVDFNSKENLSKLSDKESNFIRKPLNEIKCENENELKYVAVPIKGRANKNSRFSKGNSLDLDDKEINTLSKNANVTEHCSTLYKPNIDSTKPAITPLNLNSHVYETATISQDNFEDTIIHSGALINKGIDDSIMDSENEQKNYLSKKIVDTTISQDNDLNNQIEHKMIIGGGSSVDKMGHPGGGSVDKMGYPGSGSVNQIGYPGSGSVDKMGYPGNGSVDKMGYSGNGSVDKIKQIRDLKHHAFDNDLNPNGVPSSIDIDENKSFNEKFVHFEMPYHKYDFDNTNLRLEHPSNLSRKVKVDRETQENMKYKSGISMVSVSTEHLTSYVTVSNGSSAVNDNPNDNEKLSPKVDPTADRTSNISSSLSELNNAANPVKQMNNLIEPEDVSVEMKKKDVLTFTNKQEETIPLYATETTTYFTAISSDSSDDITPKMDLMNVQNYTVQSNSLYNPILLDIMLPIIFASLIIPPERLIKRLGYKSLGWGELFPINDILKEIDLNSKYHRNTYTFKKCHVTKNSIEEEKVMNSEILQISENYPINWTKYESIKWSQGHSKDSTAEGIDTLLHSDYKSKHYITKDKFLKLSTLRPSETSLFSSSGDLSSTYNEIDEEINLLKYRKINQNFVENLKKKSQYPQSFISYSFGNNLPPTKSLRQSSKTYDSECCDWKKSDQTSKRHNNNDIVKNISKKTLKMNKNVQDLANRFDSLSSISNEQFRLIYNKISKPIEEKINYCKKISQRSSPPIIYERNNRIFDKQTNRSRHVSHESKRSNWFNETGHYTSSEKGHNRLLENTNFSKEFLNRQHKRDLIEYFPKYSNKIKDSNILSQKEESIMLCKNLMRRVETQDRELSEKLSRLFDDQSNKIYNAKRKLNENVRDSLIDQQIFPFKFHSVNLNIESNLSNNLSTSKFKFFGQQFPVGEEIANSINQTSIVCESNLKFTSLNRLNLSYATIEDKFNDVEYCNLMNDGNKYNFQEKLRHISYEDCMDMFEKLFASDDAELEDEWSLNPELELPIFDTKSNGDKIREPRNNIYNVLKDESYSNIKTTELAENPRIKKYEPLQSSNLKTGSMDHIIYGEMVDNIFENQSFIIRPKIVRTVSRVKPKITTKKLRQSKIVKQKISCLISDKIIKHTANYFKNNSKSPIPTKRHLNYRKKLDFSAYLNDRQISAYICPKRPKITTCSRNNSKAYRRKSNIARYHPNSLKWQFQIFGKSIK